MDNYIALLFLVMPGYISRKIYKQTSNIREDLNTFEETMYSLLNSALIVMIIMFWLLLLGVDSYSAFQERFNKTYFIIEYGISALILACLLGMCTEQIREQYNKAINFIRKSKKMALVSISKDVLDEMLISDGMEIKKENGITIPRFIAIYKDGTLLARGGLLFATIKRREFNLENCEQGIESYLKNNGKMPPIKKIYIDGRLGLTIKEYDLSNLSLQEE